MNSQISQNNEIVCLGLIKYTFVSILNNERNSELGTDVLFASYVYFLLINFFHLMQLCGSGTFFSYLSTCFCCLKRVHRRQQSFNCGFHILTFSFVNVILFSSTLFMFTRLISEQTVAHLLATLVFFFCVVKSTDLDGCCGGSMKLDSLTKLIKFRVDQFEIWAIEYTDILILMC